MSDLTATTALPLLISALTAASVAYFTMGTDVQFHFEVTHPFALSQLPYYAVLGVFCALVSLYFLRTTDKVEGLIARLRNPWAKVAVGGVVLGLLIFLFPPLYGEGYDVIHQLINGDNLSALHNSPFEKYLIPTEFYAGLSTLNTQLLLLVFRFRMKLFPLLEELRVLQVLHNLNNQNGLIFKCL